MFETILVATDGSEHAGKAVHLAADIAGRYEARMVLLHILPQGPLSEELRQMARVEGLLSDSGPDGGPLSPKAKSAASVLGTSPEREQDTQRVRQFMADKILSEAKRVAQNKGVETVATAVAEGDPAQEILQQAEKEAANLVVMGSRGLSDLKGLLMGSVSHKVSQLCPCSCVTVK